MQQTNNPEQGLSGNNSPMLHSETIIYRLEFNVGKEEILVWFELSSLDNLPLFSKVKDVAEHLLEPSAFQAVVIKAAIIKEFERHGFKQHFPE